MRKSKTSLICCVILMLITFAFYLLVLENVFETKIYWISMLFILLSEIILCIKLLWIKGKIFKLTNLYFSIIHIVLVILVSTIYINDLTLNINLYLFINITFILILIILDLIILKFKKSIDINNTSLNNARKIIDECYSKAKQIEIDCIDNSIKNEISQICELLKYSDNSILCGNEEEILLELNELDKIKNNQKIVNDKINLIKGLIERRTVLIKQSKKGNF